MRILSAASANGGETDFVGIMAWRDILNVLDENALQSYLSELGPQSAMGDPCSHVMM